MKHLRRNAVLLIATLCMVGCMITQAMGAVKTQEGQLNHKNVTGSAYIIDTYASATTMISVVKADYIEVNATYYYYNKSTLEKYSLDDSSSNNNSNSALIHFYAPSNYKMMKIITSHFVVYSGQTWTAGIVNTL